MGTAAADAAAAAGERVESEDKTSDAFASLNHVGLKELNIPELLRIHGRNELPEKIVPKYLLFSAQLIGPMPGTLTLFLLQTHLDHVSVTLKLPRPPFPSNTGSQA